MAKAKSQKFNDRRIEKRLKLAQISKLESDAAKNRQEIFESVEKMYGPKKDD